jgi:hypothetical protein
LPNSILNWGGDIAKYNFSDSNCLQSTPEGMINPNCKLRINANATGIVNISVSDTSNAPPDNRTSNTAQYSISNGQIQKVETKVNEHIGGTFTYNGTGFTPNQTDRYFTALNNMTVSPPSVNTNPSGQWSNQSGSVQSVTGTINGIGLANFTYDDTSSDIASPDVYGLPKPVITFGADPARVHPGQNLIVSASNFLTNSTISWNSTPSGSIAPGCTTPSGGTPQTGSFVNNCSVVLGAGIKGQGSPISLSVTDLSSNSQSNNVSDPKQYTVYTPSDLALSPAGGKQDTPTEVTLSATGGFFPDADIWYKGCGQTDFTLLRNSDGNIVKFTQAGAIPSGTKVTLSGCQILGNNDITIADANAISGINYATAQFYATASQISIIDQNKVQEHIGGHIDIQGAGFYPSEGARYLSSSGVSVGLNPTSVTTDAAGNWQNPSSQNKVEVQGVGQPGISVIRYTDRFSSVYQSPNIEFIPSPAVTSIAPQAGPAGSNITINASANFLKNSYLSWRIDSTTGSDGTAFTVASPACNQTNGNGQIEGCTFAIPSGLSNGVHTINVTDSSNSTYWSQKTANFAFTVSTPGVKSSDYIVHPNQTFTISNADGAFWSSTNQVTITATQSGFTQEGIVEQTVNPDGTFSANLTIPQNPTVLNSSITVRDLPNGITSETLPIKVAIPGNVTVNPPSGPSTKTVTLSGSGFIPTKMIYYKGCTGGYVASGISADSQGNVSGISVPLSGCSDGDNDIFLSDTPNGDSYTFGIGKYTVYEPSISALNNKTQEHITGNIVLNGEKFTPTINEILFNVPAPLVASPASIRPVYGTWTTSVSSSSPASGNLTYNDPSVGAIPSPNMTFIDKPTILLSRYSGVPNQPITVTQGSDSKPFLPTSNLIWAINGSVMQTPPDGCASSDSNGKLPSAGCTITPGQIAGDYNITVTDNSNANDYYKTASATYWGIKPNLAVEPESGPQNVRIFIFGSGYEKSTDLY